MSHRTTATELPRFHSRVVRGRYCNHWEPAMETRERTRAIWKWLISRKRDPDPARSFPILASDVVPRVAADHLRVTYIGHATLLVQIAGLNILTDPVFGERCSPVQWAGLRRFTPPGLSFGQLPEIDVVLISHNHYDHLDDGSIRRLGARPLYIVPKGVASWVRKRGAVRVHEFDWWQGESLQGFDAVCAPAQHFSARTPWDRCRTLWCSWMIRAGGRSFYFGGDSGYFGGYREIHDRLGAPDVALLPVGAYKPRNIMREYHMDPGEAVQAFLDLQAQRFVPIHWGTFKLTDEALDEPIRLLHEEWRARGLDSELLWALAHGEARDYLHAGAGT